ncbi:MAG TPA: AAA family ATPase [Candidatus Omnitrophota bacterium]|nr:AAA family ATPase [Candidatus Omnitrophota bacterium]
MYFKKLELFGFKSFADKTTLNFEPGITAIVGPNGCGKSNIFDAIRWVLGEQSVKELRGSAMEDVIFNGTQSKPSLGFAEVSLTFSNESKMLPIEYDEVTVTRRLFRSGESEYLLNKARVRLKDIQELLMGTGMGAEAYSLVQQGKVDLVVSAKPEDRRMILDEAAGITKYKAKKKEALSKLKSTEENLLRVSDITREVQRQITSIERQANKARKYKEEYDKLKNLEVCFARYEMQTFIDQQQGIEAQLNEIKDKEAELNRQHDTLSEQLTQEINRLDELEAKINDLHAQEIKLDGQIEMNNRQIGFNQERIGGLKEAELRLVAQKEQSLQRCRAQQGKIEELKEMIRQVEETIKGNDEVIKDKKDLLRSLERFIADAREKIKENEEKILNLTSKQVNVRNQLTDIMKEIQSALARKRRLEVETQKVTEEKQSVEQKSQNVDFQIKSIQGTVQELEQTIEQKNKEIAELRQRMQEMQSQMDELEKKKVFFKSQKELIEKLNTQYGDIPDPVSEGKFITDIPPQEHHTGLVGKVKEVREITQKGGGFFATQEVKRLFEIVCETKFIELDPQQISLKIAEIEQQIEGLEIEKQHLKVHIEEAGRKLGQLEQEIHNKEKVLSILRSQKNDLGQEAQKFSDELELVQSELVEVQDTLTEARKREEEVNYELDTVNQDISWCQNDIKDKQGAISHKTQEKEQVTVSIAQLETEVQSAKENFISHQENVRLFSESLDNSLEEIKKIEDEVAGFDGKKKQYESEIESLQSKTKETEEAKYTLRQDLSTLEVQKNKMGETINEWRSKMTEVEEQGDGLKQTIHDHQMNLQQINFSEQGIKDRLSQTYKINWDELSQELAGVLQENQESPAPAVAIAPEAMQEELDKLRKRCESYGNVNLVAIEEYDELKQRFEFLTKQQSDLLEAKSQLMATIQKINRSTRQMFMDTFTKVSEEFRIYFRMLFGGGEAELILLDPENVLESGIEIIARPPGKKLQSISLLSGGEKTLTAIALIFGVFKVNPSPFCVLDEIDAALDESNVGRFSYLLKDFAKIAQFIVITHNKKTIAGSDIMYGITMPETGISRIVSVKMKEAKEEKEVAVV